MFGLGQSFEYESSSVDMPSGDSYELTPQDEQYIAREILMAKEIHKATRAIEIEKAVISALGFAIGGLLASMILKGR